MCESFGDQHANEKGSATELHTARELALVDALEVAKNELQAWIKCAYENGLCVTSTPHVIDHIDIALASLSSPGHAYAGKVEGDDGRPCSMDEFMAALFNEKVDEFDVSEAAASWLHGDWKDALSYLTDVPTHWRPLPSAPCQEVAG